jgi:hypothetical protein
MDDRNQPGEAEHLHQRERSDGSDDNEALRALRRLSVNSPDHTFQRFRRRATVVQGTRMLFESQVSGFWIVLDAFLRLALGGSTAKPEATTPQGDEA